MRRFYIGSMTPEGVMRLDNSEKGPFCYADDAEKEFSRLREAFGKAVERITEAWLGHDANKLDEAILAARQIAREGR